MTLPRAYISRECHGQLRFKLPRRKGDTEFFRHAAEVLERLEAVDSLQVNPMTGSILVYHHSSLKEIAGFARKNELFALAHHAKDPLPPKQQRSIDLATATTLLLVLLGLIQVARGRVLGPASTLLWIAWQLASKGQSPKGDSKAS